MEQSFVSFCVNYPWSKTVLNFITLDIYPAVVATYLAPRLCLWRPGLCHVMDSHPVDSLTHTLDSILVDQSFITGHVPTSLDSQVFSQLSSPPTPQFPNLFRWYRNLNSFSDKEKKKFVKTKVKLNEALKMVVAENTMTVAEKKSIIQRNRSIRD